jgi:hypothetical protein
MRGLSVGHALALALVITIISAKRCGAATFGCGVDVGLGLAFPQYTGAIEARFAMARAGRLGLEYRHTVAAFWGSTLAAAPNPGEDAHVETLVLVREWPFRSDRIGGLVSVGAGVGRASVEVRSGLDFRGQPRYVLQPKIGPALTLGVGLRFPRSMGPVATHLALREQVVVAGDAFSRAQNATVFTLGLAY